MAGLRLLTRKSPTPWDLASLPQLCSRCRRKSWAEGVGGERRVEKGSISEYLKILQRRVALGQLGSQPGDQVLVTPAQLHKSSFTGTQQAVPRKEAVSRTVGSLQPTALLGLRLLPKRTCHLDLTNHPPFLPRLSVQTASPSRGLLDCWGARGCSRAEAGKGFPCTL